MKKIFYLLHMLLLCGIATSQTLITEQFASSVISFSSEFSPTPANFSAAKLLGAPEYYPQCGSNGNNWAPATQNGSREYFVLGYSTPQPVNTIRIYQSWGPGAVDTIYLRNASNGVWTKVYETTAINQAACPGTSSMLMEVVIPTTAYNVDAIRVAINSPLNTNWNEFDAVSIANFDLMPVQWEQYGANVISFSSEFAASPANFSASRTIGAPNAGYDCNTDGQAWASAAADNQREYLELGYAYPAYINRVRIYQNENPGAIDTVYLRNANTGTWVQIYSATAAAKPCPQNLLLEINFTKTTYPVDAVRIALNSPLVPDWNEIDAIGINSELPPNAKRSAQSGNFNNTATWAGGVIPSSSDTVVIGAGHTITLNANATIDGLFINKGGTFTINAANTLTIGPSAGGSRQVNVDGSLTMSNGALNIAGNLKFTAGSTFNMSGGSITVDGNDGTATGSVPVGVNIVDFITGMAAFSFTGGTLTIVDPPANATSNALRSAFNFSSGSTLKFGNGVSSTAGVSVNGFGGNTLPLQIGNLVIDAVTSAGNRLFKPTVAMTMNGDFTLASGRFETSAINTTVLGNSIISGTLQQGGSFRTTGNITINTGASMINAVNSSVVVGDDLINNGTMSFSFVYFANSTSVATTNAQTLGGTGIFSPHNNGSFFINNTNAAGVSLATSITIIGINFISGKVFLGNYDFSLEAGISGSANANNYIVTNGTGRLVRTAGSSSFTAHIGPDASSYNPVIHTGMSGHSFAYRVRVGFDPANPPLNNSVVKRQWNIDDLTGGAINSTLTFQWNAAHEDGAFDRSISYVGRYNGTAWTRESSPAPASGSNPYTKTANNVTSFSPFGIGSGGALPVTLIDFTAGKINNTVKLEWTVEGETSFSHYEIEKSSDGKNYNKVKTMMAVNGGNRKTYSSTDEIGNGIYYYRLKMVDLNGTFSYSKVLRIDAQRKITVTVYPNPGRDKIFIQNINKYETSHIIDMSGRLIKQNIIAGNGYVNISDLKPGVYFFKLMGKEDSQTISFIKE